MHKKLLALAMATLIAFGATGCVKTPKLENGEEILAEIDGKKFTARDLYDSLKSEYGTDSLVNMIDNFIIEQELESTDNAKTQAKAYIKQMKSYYESAGQDWNTVLSSNGVTESFLIENYTLNYAKQEVAEKYFKESVTEDEINKFYKNEIIGDITAKHILITVDADEDMTDEEKSTKEKEAYNKALEVIEKLNDGKDFKELAKEYSDDQSASAGGALAPFNKQSNYTEEFLNAAIKLNEGEYSKTPVKSKYGYHIILVEKKAEKPSLEDVKDTIIDEITEEKMNENENYVNTAWKNLRSKYNLAIYDTIIEEKYNTAMSKY